MTKIELICLLIEIVLSFFAAIMFLSDIVAERKDEYRKLKVVISIVLASIASFQLAILLEYYYALEFKILDVGIYTFLFLMVYFVISVAIGNYKIKKDAIKECITFTHSQNDDNFVEIRENLEEIENCYRVVNDCKIVSFEDMKKNRKGKK